MWQFFDKTGKLPFEKKRIDITISFESLDKIKEMDNKSKFIDELIIGS
jgi:hypothetical protein